LSPIFVVAGHGCIIRQFRIGSQRSISSANAKAPSLRGGQRQRQTQFGGVRCKGIYVAPGGGLP
jgi:hypothetical protein